jgi:hypothetical protein
MPRLMISALLIIFFSISAIKMATAEMVVIASSAPDVVGGQLFKDGETLEVPAGASVTLVSAAGAALTIDGPFSGVPGGDSGGGGDNALVSSLSSLLSAGDKKTTSLGVMRSGVSKDPDDPWTVNIDRSGKQCVRAGVSAVLWRPDSKKATVLKIKNATTKKRTESKWPAGADTLTWPDGSTVNDGESFVMRTEGSRAAKKVTLFVVPADLPSVAHKAVWMAQKGCSMQAKLLLKSIK